MERSERLQLTGRGCYYLAWLLALLAAVGHFTRLNVTLGDTLNISGRNLLEASIVLFVACIATEVRLLALTSGAKSPGAK